MPQLSGQTAVVCLIHSAFALWFLGYPNCALDRNDRALSLAAKLCHPVTTAIAVALAAQIQQFCGNPRAVEELARIAVDLSTQHDPAFTKAIGIILQGWTLTQGRQKEAGVERMRSGLEVLRATDAVVMVGYFSGLLAEAYGDAGQAEEGLKIPAGVDSTRERYWKAELKGLEGELLLRRPAGLVSRENQCTKAEDYFRRAIDIAQAQNAKSLELRATMSLCRLWQARPNILKRAVF